jgi:hypothetical protein
MTKKAKSFFFVKKSEKIFSDTTKLVDSEYAVRNDVAQELSVLCNF